MRKVNLFLLLVVFFMQDIYSNDQKKLLQLGYGHIIARTIHVACKYQIFDYLARGVGEAEKLAQLMNVNQDFLTRILRFLASYEIVAETTTNFFELTSLGQWLRSDISGSLRNEFLMEDETRWNSIGNLDYTLKSGEPTFNHYYHMPYFNFISQQPLLSAAFDKGMREISSQEHKAIVESDFDFSKYQTILDIGGGRGGLLWSILTKYSGAKGILYDLPNVLENEMELDVFPLLPRCKLISGSFFETIPDGSDLLILKRVIHDWPDNQAITILKNCSKVINKNQKLLIIDAILPLDNQRNLIRDIDIFLWVIFGGKERTLEEFEKIFYAAGLRISRVIATRSMLSIIELEKNF